MQFGPLPLQVECNLTIPFTPLSIVTNSPPFAFHVCFFLSRIGEDQVESA